MVSLIWKQPKLLLHTTTIQAERQSRLSSTCSLSLSGKQVSRGQLENDHMMNQTSDPSTDIDAFVLTWAIVSAVRVVVTIGVLAYIVKCLVVEKHFLVVLIVDNTFCLLMSLAGIANHVLTIYGFHNLTSCLFTFILLYYTVLAGVISTALVSVFR